MWYGFDWARSPTLEAWTEFHAKTLDTNRLFRERIVRQQIVQRVRNYVDQLLGSSPTSSQPADVPPASGPISGEAVESPATESATGPRPEQIAQTKWLVEQNFITEPESERLLRSSNLPKDFAERVLARFPAAEVNIAPQTAPAGRGGAG